MSEKRLDPVRLFGDGACSVNPGPGGWAYILERTSNGSRKIGSGYQAHTTNNQMELMAVIEGLRALKPEAPVEIVTDSEYVGKGIMEWLPLWVRRGWKTKEKKPVKNRELWEELHALLSARQYKVTVVRGHSGHPENEECDELARLEIEKRHEDVFLPSRTNWRRRQSG